MRDFNSRFVRGQSICAQLMSLTGIPAGEPVHTPNINTCTCASPVIS